MVDAVADRAPATPRVRGDAAGGAWPLAFALARRELRGGLKGFRIFLVCLMLGVTIIAAVGSVAQSVLSGIGADARAILGGDLELRLIYQPATPEQQALMKTFGEVSALRGFRAMAKRTDADGGDEAQPATDRTLVELKGVDAIYPLYGDMQLEPAQPLADALARRDGVWGAVAERTLLDRLGLAVGDRVRVGSLDYELRAAIAREPDRGADIFDLGPRLMVADASLEATGLVQTGSLIYHFYRLRLNDGATAAAAQEALEQAWPDAGWRIRGLDDAAPRVKRFIDRTGLFLTLVGLSALLVGGVGVGNAVRSYLDGKTATIATLKCLGAPSRLIFRTYLTLIMLLALGGIAAGLVVGALVPWIVSGALEGYGLSVLPGVFPAPLALAAGFGLLVAFAFSLWPLARARDVPAATLFRDLVARGRARLRRADLLTLGGAAAALAALTIASASDRWLALWFVGGVIATLLLFRGAANLIIAAARRANRPDRAQRLSPTVRLAIANLSRPGAATSSVVLSLGLGLTVLVAIALVQGNLARELQDTLPETAPSFFFLDIQPPQVAEFDALVGGFPGVDSVSRVPMLRGRITAIKGVPAAEAKISPEVNWVLQGDRGFTWAATPPENTVLVDGQWWAEDYAGEPLISIGSEVAEGLGLAIGDSLTVNLLGREITGTIANTRDIDWQTLSINFLLIFSPGVMETAPQTHLATARADPAQEIALQKAVTERFANVSAIRVKEALQAVSEMLTSIGIAIQGTAGLTLLAGILVLAGAVVAGHHRRVYEAVVLKVLGATRRDIAKAFLLEYGLLGLVTAAIAVVIGSLAGYGFLTGMTDTPFTLLPGVVLGTAALSTAITLLLGFAGTWRALGVKAAPLLRNE